MDYIQIIAIGILTAVIWNLFARLKAIEGHLARRLDTLSNHLDKMMEKYDEAHANYLEKRFDELQESLQKDSISDDE